MHLPKELTTVTPLSKAVALLLFISLPIISFIFGMNYQAGYFDKKMAPTPTAEPVACTMDAKICPDGSAVGRVPPNCEFETCPQIGKTTGKKFTGIINNLQYDCHFDGICGVQVGKAFVVVDKGEGPVDEPRIRGDVPEDLMNEDKKSEFIGKQVEVYAAPDRGRTDSYTLFGDSEYYIQLVTKTSSSGGFCGGIMGKICPSGYYCKYDGTYPDAGGTCIKTNSQTKFTCPDTDYVDCMPGPDRGKNIQCSTEYLNWAQENCPGFQGAAY